MQSLHESERDSQREGARVGVKRERGRERVENMKWFQRERNGNYRV
jgi:hypothetical protein